MIKKRNKIKFLITIIIIINIIIIIPTLKKIVKRLFYMISLLQSIIEKYF